MKFTALTCLFLILALSVSPLFEVTNVVFAHDEETQEEDDRGFKEIVADATITVGAVVGIVGTAGLLFGVNLLEMVPVVGTAPGGVAKP